jgi:hypothetical protein
LRLQAFGFFTLRPGRCLAWFLLLFLSGCASRSEQSHSDEISGDGGTIGPTIRVLDEGKLELSLQVLGRKQLEQELGIDLTIQRIRGIWVEIENHSDSPYWLLRSSLDWDYYPPDEILYTYAGQLDDKQFQALKKKLLNNRFRNPVRPHSRTSGYLFISSNHLNRVAQLSLLGVKGTWEVPVYLPVPELQGYHLPTQFHRYRPEEIVDTDMEGLHRLLQTLPCCTTDAAGKGAGDPLNLVLVGRAPDLYYAFAARGWHTVEINYLASAEKTIQSFLFGNRYRYSPVSPLYAFGRKQDYALQKARANISQRNHLRLWLTPWQVNGTPVWVGQVSRDIGVHMTSRSPFFFTHKIDPDVDEDRNYLVEDLLLTGQVIRFGYLGGLGKSSQEQPRRNLTGDPYYTDCLRAVIFLGSHKEPRFIPRRGLEFLHWHLQENTPHPRHIDLPQ